ncbi:MAG: DUF4139 domain-containing protein [Bacteroidales bacterium]|nr:DUF4139 domain-containing protein [Bacteroidales bacterium]MCF8404721.1 DUF4139 domain-containing protein [Bacteroidales bacterium]
MKKLLTGVLFLSFLAPLQASTKKVKSKIDDVTVYLQGAQIFRTSNVEFTQGIAEIIFEDIPVGLDESSIQVKVPDGLKILSVNYRINEHKDVTQDSELAENEKILKANQLEIKKLKAELNVYTEEEKILLANTSFSGKENGVNLAELKLAADYFRNRLQEIGSRKLEIENKISDLTGKITQIKNDISVLRNARPEPSGEIFVKVQSQSTGSKEVHLSYFLNAAGWIPAYDIRVKNVSKPLELSVKARVFQNTGEDWDKVKLVLSTTNPKKSNTKPELKTWFLGYGRIHIKSQPGIYGGISSLQGKITDQNTGEPIPFANIVLEKNGRQISGGTSDYSGNYQLSSVEPGYYDLKVSFIGYKTQHTRGLVLNQSQVSYWNIPMEPTSSTLEEIVITSYNVPLIDKDNTISGGTVSGEEIHKIPNRNANAVATSVGGVHSENSRGARDNEDVIYVDGLRVAESEIYLPQQQVQTPTNIRYEVEVPYSIPSDGEKYTVRIVDHNIPTTYEYYCAPSIDDDVYLVAQLTDWGKLNLLSGESTIYFEGNYVGRSFLDARTTEDTLNVSVGRDNNIVIIREQNKDLKKLQTIGSNVKETRAYKITVRNNRDLPINLVLEDRIPVPTIKDISVELFEDVEADHDEDTGILSWKLELKSKENKELNFGYIVKYPKGKTVVLD